MGRFSDEGVVENAVRDAHHKASSTYMSDSGTGDVPSTRFDTTVFIAALSAAGRVIEPMQLRVAAETVCRLLEHETAAVTIIEQVALRDALDPRDTAGGKP